MNMSRRQVMAKFCDRHCRMPCDRDGNIYWYEASEKEPRRQPCRLLDAKIKELEESEEKQNNERVSP